ncbi:hypothetical protein B296_00051619, partial [Ensete ventricosum]
ELPLLATVLPLAALQRAAATCGLAVGVQACGAAAAAGGRPCKGAGRGHARLPLARASFAAKT